MANPLFPTLRKYYAGIDNPLFLGDITTADQSVLDGLTAVLGVSGTDFFIVSGLEYVLGTPNTYNSGIIFLNGSLFLVQASFVEGLYLAANPTDVLLETFDTVPPTTNYIYTNFYAQTTSSSSGNSPVFSGNMNQYRLGSKFLQAQIQTILGITADLGTTAFTDLGTGTRQVLTADQTYTQTQVNEFLAQKSPSVIGETKNILDIPGTFLTNFNGDGNGIVYPWIGWHLLNGLDGYPDATGKMMVGAGAGFPITNQGGANSYEILATDLPELKSTSDFATGSGGVAAYAKVNTAGSAGQLAINQGSPNNAISLLSEYIVTYVVYRFA